MWYSWVLWFIKKKGIKGKKWAFFFVLSPRLLSSLSVPFPAATRRRQASGAALCQCSSGASPADKSMSALSLPFPSFPAVRNRTPEPLPYAICIRIWPCILPILGPPLIQSNPSVLWLGCCSLARGESITRGATAVHFPRFPAVLLEPSCPRSGSPPLRHEAQQGGSEP